MTKPAAFGFLTPWEEIPDSPEGRARAEKLLNELKREISSNHALSGLTLKAVAVRRNQDDVLFEVLANKEQFAVVHMTWRQETDQRWPRTRFFASWEQWVDEAMIPDHEDFTCGDTPWW